MSDLPIPPDDTFNHRNVLPGRLVTHALGRLQQHLAAPPADSPEWEALCRSPGHQGYAHYISQAALLIAPNDAKLRGDIASALLELYYMKDNADLVNEISDFA